MRIPRADLKLDLLLPLLLAAATLAAFWGVWDHAFVDYDDQEYVFENPEVQAGLSWSNLVWALTTSRASNWHPLAWLSHMLDVELYGLDPGGHHLTSLLLHLTSVCLLYLALRRMTARPWPSAFVALLFAIHPLHVESVAWVAERKDTLSTVFWMLCLLAWLGWLRRGGGWRYALLVVLFALGLMAKPMLVTLPFTLLLLDWWPLGRVAGGPAAAAPRPGGPLPGERGRMSPVWAGRARRQRESGGERQPGKAGRPEGGPAARTDEAATRPAGFGLPWGRLVLEKAPLFALSLASSVVTYLVQQRGGAMEFVVHVPRRFLLGNALAAYGWYLGKSVWPARLAVFYPHPGTGLDWWRPAAAALLILAVSAAALFLAWRRPYFAVGWAWFLGTLVPVIGIVQVGGQAVADRYTYVPLIGLFLAATWAAADLVRHRGVSPAVPCLVAAVLALGLVTATRRQVAYWRDGVTLFQHALTVAEESADMHYCLGAVLLRQGDPAGALEHFRRALLFAPDDPAAMANRGAAFLAVGKLDGAREMFEAALDIAPQDVVCHYNLGIILLQEGRVDEAIDRFHQVLRIRPGHLLSLKQLGLALAGQGRLAEAEGALRELVRLAPEDANAHNLLGASLEEQGKTEEAVHSYEEALRLNPGHGAARENLGRLRPPAGS